MIWNPMVGQRVRIHYAKKTTMPYQDAEGMVEIVTMRHFKGPRNALIKLDDGRLVIVSRGNLVPIRGGE